MPTATMTSKGQITVPKEIRLALGLRKGDRVSFRMRRDGVVEIVPESMDLLKLGGLLKPRRRGVTLEEMERVIVDGARGE